MTGKRLLSWVVLLICVAGAVYYAAVNNETQGAIVVLLGILFFVALPHLSSTES